MATNFDPARLAAVLNVPLVLSDGRWNLGMWEEAIEPASPSGRASLLVCDGCIAGWRAYQAMLTEVVELHKTEGVLS